MQSCLTRRCCADAEEYLHICNADSSPPLLVPPYLGIPCLLIFRAHTELTRSTRSQIEEGVSEMYVCMYIIRENDEMTKRYIHMFKPYAAVKKDEEPKIQVFFQQFPPSKACPMHKNKCSFFSLQYLFSPVIKAPCDSLSYLQPNVNVHAIDPPLPLAQQIPQPLDPQASPLVAQHSNLLRSGASSGFRCRIDHVDEGVVEGEGEGVLVLG